MALQDKLDFGILIFFFVCRSFSRPPRYGKKEVARWTRTRLQRAATQAQPVGVPEQLVRPGVKAVRRRVDEHAYYKTYGEVREVNRW